MRYLITLICFNTLALSSCERNENIAVDNGDKETKPTATHFNKLNNTDNTKAKAKNRSAYSSLRKPKISIKKEGASTDETENLLTFGKEKIPEAWFRNADESVKMRIEGKEFSWKMVDSQWTLGVFVKGEAGGDMEFITWPNARRIAPGDSPDDYLSMGNLENVKF